MRMSGDEPPQMMMGKCDVRMEKINKLKLPSVVTNTHFGEEKNGVR
jgi:hypothetical protein